jgi:hypothetical protein
VNKLSQLISWVFLPFFMPLYGLLIVLFLPFDEVQKHHIPMYALPLNIKWIVFFLFVLFCCVAPGISFIILFRYRIVSHIQMVNRKERNYPFIIAIIYCSMLYWLLLQSDPKGLLPIYLSRLALASLVVTTLFFGVNFVRKISIHAGGAGVLTGFLYAYFMDAHNPSLLWISVALFVSGCVISARWFLQKHSALELVLGYVVASLTTGIIVAW